MPPKGAKKEKEENIINSTATAIAEETIVQPVITIPDTEPFVKKVNVFLPPEIEQTIEFAVETNLPVLLIGETGTGKTTIVREMARKRGSELIRLNLTGQTGVDEFIGKWLASPEKGTYWLDGMLIQAMKNGNWVVLDEVNMALPEILTALHSLLDDDRKVVLKEKDGEVVRPAESFRIFATMNPEDEYAGTKELNKAFLSRFPAVLHVSYSDKEHQIVTEQSGIEPVKAEILLRIAHEIRAAKKRGTITYTCSTRDIISAARMIKGGLPVFSSLSVSMINKAPQDERDGIKQIIELITGKKSVTVGSTSYKSIEDMIEEFRKSADVITHLKRDKDSLTEQIKSYQTALTDRTKDVDEAKKALKSLVEGLEAEKAEHEKTKNKTKKLVEVFEEVVAEVNKKAASGDVASEPAKDVSSST